MHHVLQVTHTNLFFFLKLLIASTQIYNKGFLLSSRSISFCMTRLVFKTFAFICNDVPQFSQLNLKNGSQYPQNKKK